MEEDFNPYNWEDLTSDMTIYFFSAVCALFILLILRLFSIINVLILEYGLLGIFFLLLFALVGRFVYYKIHKDI